MNQPPHPPSGSFPRPGQGAPMGPGPVGFPPLQPGGPFPGYGPSGHFRAGQVPPGQFPPGQFPPGAYGPAGPGGPGPHLSSAQRPRSVAVGMLGRIAAVPLVALGLSIPFDSSCGWASYLAWSIFAMVAAIAQLLPVLGDNFGWSPPTGWLIGAVGTGALLVFWVLIALPSITGDGSFCLTLGTAAAAAGCWLSPGRRW